VFFLTAPELAGPLPPDARDLVARRREARERYSTLEIPLDWTGMPAASPAEPAAGRTGEAGGTLSGLGVSGGVIEGPARVLTSPDFTEVEPDEVLVAHTTDPSWSSIMFLSSALVMDIGGALSHAAVVAREIGIPCVVDTRNGTRALKTGDRVRVDGDAGTVEFLGRADGAHRAEPASR
jgi:rifampicin phosphotransferase